MEIGHAPTPERNRLGSRVVRNSDVTSGAAVIPAPSVFLVCLVCSMVYV